MNDVEIAKVCHEVNRAYCKATGDEFGHISWEASPDQQRDSAIAGVRLHRENPNTTPEQSHDAWFRLKKEEGWTYGPFKISAEKIHPCMVEYEKLSADQRVKGVLFKAVCRALL